MDPAEVIPVRHRLNFKNATITLPGSLVGEFGLGLEGGEGEGNLFRAVGRIFRQVGDVVESGGGVKNARGELVTDEGGIGEVWSCCFEGLLSEGGVEIFSVIGEGW